MPFLLLIATIASVGIAAAAFFWPKILHWARMNLSPWVEANMPWLTPYLEDAYTRIDKHATKLVRDLKSAWNELRARVLKQLQEYEWLDRNTWLLRTKNFIIKNLEDPT